MAELTKYRRLQPGQSLPCGVLIQDTGRRSKGYAIWQFRCRCGGLGEGRSDSLKAGTRVRCQTCTRRVRRRYYETRARGLHQPAVDRLMDLVICQGKSIREAAKSLKLGYYAASTAFRLRIEALKRTPLHIVRKVAEAVHARNIYSGHVAEAFGLSRAAALYLVNRCMKAAQTAAQSALRIRPSKADNAVHGGYSGEFSRAELRMTRRGDARGALAKAWNVLGGFGISLLEHLPGADVFRLIEEQGSRTLANRRRRLADWHRDRRRQQGRVPSRKQVQAIGSARPVYSVLAQDALLALPL